MTRRSKSSICIELILPCCISFFSACKEETGNKKITNSSFKQLNKITKLSMAGIYIHIPFCKKACHYCNFHFSTSQRQIPKMIGAICAEGALKNDYLQEDIATVYFGGGTPSLLMPEQVEKILGSVASKFSVSSDPEITMEMNPATVSDASLAAYRSLGVNRASFGVQTFDDRALKLLARGHDAKDARETFATLRTAGFDNVSFDLIAGLPGQSLAGVFNESLATPGAQFPKPRVGDAPNVLLERVGRSQPAVLSTCVRP